MVVSDSIGTAPITFDSTDLTIAALDTRLIERLVPALEVPRHGVLAGHLAADGPLAALQLDGDVTFDDPTTGRSRVLAVGEIGTENGVVRARGLRVTLSPVQVDLARIAVSDEEVAPLQGELNAILAFVEQLGAVDVAGVEPMTSVTPMAMKKRRDVVTDGGRAEEVVANAPETEDHFFLVPKVVE